MESKEEAAVERQKLVADDEVENEPDEDQTGISSVSTTKATKTIQTPISPILSSKVFSSGETSRTQGSSNCSVSKENYEAISTNPAAKLTYVNERKNETGKIDPKIKLRKAQRELGHASSFNAQYEQNENVNVSFESRPLKHHSFISEVPDVQHMERALIGLLEDFHSGKLKAFGFGCTMEQMTDIREQQEHLAKLHFELGAGNDPMDSNCNLSAQKNMALLVQKLENLSVSIEKLHSSNVTL